MKRLVSGLFLILIFGLSCFAQICDETGSYSEIRTKEARDRESRRDEREKYYATLTPEQLERVSDFETYPTLVMECGMGFSNGLGKVFVDGKAGFINTKGEVVIKPQFKYAGRFQENLAPVEFDDGKWGYIDKKGEVVIKPVFDWALIFREGRALVQVGKKWGFINSKGKMIIKPQFDHAASFSEGLAKFQIWGIDKLNKDSKVLKTGYIDRFGRRVIKPVWDGGFRFLNGQAVVNEHLFDEAGKKTYYGCFLINKKGKKISKELEECSGYSDEWNLLDETGITLAFEEYKTGYKDRQGKNIWIPTK